MKRPLLLLLALPAAVAGVLVSACEDDDGSGAGGFDAGTFDGSTWNPDAASADAATPGPDTGTDSGPTDGGTDGASDDGGTHPDKFLYFAANAGSSLAGFAISASTGELTPIDMDSAVAGVQAIPTAHQPLAVAASTNGKFVFTAHTNGDVGAYAVDSTTGKLTHVDVDGAMPGIQEFNAGGGAGLFGIAADPKGRVLYGADFSNNQVVTMSVDGATGALAVVRRTTVSAVMPRGIVVDPNAEFLFVMGSGGPGTVTRLVLDASGLPLDADAGVTEDLAIPGSGNCVSAALSPAGRFYTSCAQDQKLHAVAYDPADGGALVSVGAAIAGIGPIGVAVHPSGKFAYAASTSSGTITHFSLDANGSPTVVGSPVEGVGLCRALAVDSAGAHLYAGCDGQVLRFSVDPATGALSNQSKVTGPGDSTYSFAFVRGN